MLLAPAVRAGAYAARQATSWMWATQVFIVLLATVFVVVRPQPTVAYAWLALAAIAHIGVYLRDRMVLVHRHSSSATTTTTTTDIVRDTGHAFNVWTLAGTGVLRVTALGLLIAWAARATDADLVGGGIFLVVLAFLEAVLSAVVVDGTRVAAVAAGLHATFLATLWQTQSEANLSPADGSDGRPSLFTVPRVWVLGHRPQPLGATAPAAAAAAAHGQQIQLDDDPSALFV